MANHPITKKFTKLVSFYTVLLLAFAAKFTTSSRLLNQQFPTAVSTVTTSTNAATVPQSSYPAPEHPGMTVPSTIEPAQTHEAPPTPIAASVQSSVFGTPSVTSGFEQPLTFFMHGFVPFYAGIVGTSFANMQNNANGANDSTNSNNDELPLVNADNLLSGLMTVIDNELTEGQGIESNVTGRAQGLSVTSSKDGTSQTLAVTAMFEGGTEDSTYDTLSFFGVYSTATRESHISIIGGTGKYESAKGFAKIQTVQPSDGAETLLKFSVHLY